MADDKPAQATVRPATVHADAEMLESGQWLIDETPNGEYAVWSCDGTLVQRARYVDGKAILEEKYDGTGALDHRKEHGPGNKLVQTFFWGGAKPPVPRSATVYLDEQRDVEETHYDEEGNRLFSTRREEVAPQHVRRYDDGKLVFEAQWSEDNVSATYFDRDGQVILRYAPATRQWELVQDGRVVDTLAEDDVAGRTRYGTWDRFAGDPSHREPAARIAAFHAAKAQGPAR